MMPFPLFLLLLHALIKDVWNPIEGRGGGGGGGGVWFGLCLNPLFLRPLMDSEMKEVNNFFFLHLSWKKSATKIGG